MLHLVQLYSWAVDSVFTSLYNDMDGVKVVKAPISDTSVSESVTEQKTVRRVINLRYLLPCFLYLVYLFDTLYLWLGSDFDWSFTGNGTSDGTLGRKLLPARVAQQADIFWIEVSLMIFGGAVQFLLHDMAPFERQFRMFAFVGEDGSLVEMKQNGKVLPKMEAEAIFKLHLKAKKFANLLIGICVIFAYPFYNGNVLLQWTASPADVKAILWASLTMPYMIMNLYVAICCFVFNCRYLRIRQRAQMELLQSLIAQSNRTIGQLTKLRARLDVTSLGVTSWPFWARFRLLNHQLNELSKQINGYSIFWSRYLSVYLTGLTFLVTYMAFLSLKLDFASNPLAATFIAYFASVLFTLLLFITLECSVLVYNNKETLKLQRIFTVHTSLAGRIPLSAAMKFDHIEADSKSIERGGFKLLDSVQINSKMFEMLFFYISSLFMKIAEHEL